MNIVFRTDASLEIGTGHVIRSLTLAHALRERGGLCKFVCREHPGNLLKLIRQQGFEVWSLPRGRDNQQSGLGSEEADPAHASWLGETWEDDAEATCGLLDDEGVDWIVVDHYALDNRWESALRSYCRKIMVIDDLADRIHDCDLLLDQNMVAGKEDRYNNKLPEKCVRLLGPEYALLQSQYAELHTRTPTREGAVEQLLIYFGGADSANLTGLAIDAFLALRRDDVSVDVVINPEGPHSESIAQQVYGHRNIALHAGLPSLASLMVKADLAIGGAGATTWERCCLGLPALVITLANNQTAIAAELDRRGLVRWLGHQNSVSVDLLTQAFGEILESGLSPSWSERCKSLVKGSGTGRVCSAIMLDARTPLRARRAELSDESLTLECANDYSFLRNCISDEVTNLAHHRAWFREQLRNVDNSRLFILETIDELAIGVVQFEYANNAWNTSHMLCLGGLDCEVEELVLKRAILELRSGTVGPLRLGSTESMARLSRLSRNATYHQSGNGVERRLRLAVCSDEESWINETIAALLLVWAAAGHEVTWVHNADELPGGDLCFLLSYGRIVGEATRLLYQHNLVIHASNLPKGRGWSPATWLILEGASRIPVTLLEAAEEVDAGPIYLQEWINLEGGELIDEWRMKIAATTFWLVQEFVADFPDVVNKARQQLGKPSSYRRRRAEDSVLDFHQPLSNQFNKLRVVDNNSYPAFFIHRGKEYVLKVFIRRQNFRGGNNSQ